MQNEYCITIFCGFLSVAYRKKAKIVVEPISLSVKPPFFLSVFAENFFCMWPLTFIYMGRFRKKNPFQKKHFYKKNITVKNAPSNCSKSPVHPEK